MVWWRRYSEQLLAAAFGLATTVLLAGEISRSFDYDEGVSIASTISRGSAVVPFTDTTVFNNHPIFASWQSVWWAIGGEGEARQRLFPVLYGALAVALLAGWAARRFGLLAGAAAGAVLMLNPMFVTQARGVRGYSLATLCVVIGVVTLVEYVRREQAAARSGSTALLVVHALAVVGAVGTHLFSGIALGAVGIGALLVLRRFDLRLWSSWVAAGVGVAAVYLPTFTELRETAEQRGTDFKPWFGRVATWEVLGRDRVTGTIIAALALAGLAFLVARRVSTRPGVGAAAVTGAFVIEDDDDRPVPEIHAIRHPPDEGQRRRRQRACDGSSSAGGDHDGQRRSGGQGEAPLVQPSFPAVDRDHQRGEDGHTGDCHENLEPPGSSVARGRTSGQDTAGDAPDGETDGPRVGAEIQPIQGLATVGEAPTPRDGHHGGDGRRGGERDPCRPADSPGDRDRTDDEQRPHHVELFLDRQGPRVFEQARFLVGREVLVALAQAVPVGDIEHRGRDLPPERLDRLVGEGRPDDHCRAQGEEGGEQSTRPPSPEGAESQSTGAFDLADRQRSDQEAGDDEEHVDTEKPAIEDFGVVQEDGADGQCPEAVESGQVAEPSGPRRRTRDALDRLVHEAGRLAVRYFLWNTSTAGRRKPGFRWSRGRVANRNGMLTLGSSASTSCDQ